MHLIDHIGEIIEENSESNDTVLHQVKVIGVNQLEQLSYCIVKRESLCESPGVGKCNICSTVQALRGKMKIQRNCF